MGVGKIFFSDRARKNIFCVIASWGKGNSSFTIGLEETQGLTPIGQLVLFAENLLCVFSMKRFDLKLFRHKFVLF